MKGGNEWAGLRWKKKGEKRKEGWNGLGLQKGGKKKEKEKGKRKKKKKKREEEKKAGLGLCMHGCDLC